MNGFPFCCRYFVGVPKDAQLVRCEIPLFEERRLGIAALAHAAPDAASTPGGGFSTMKAPLP